MVDERLRKCVISGDSTTHTSQYQLLILSTILLDVTKELSLLGGHVCTSLHVAICQLLALDVFDRCKILGHFGHCGRTTQNNALTEVLVFH